MAAAETGRPLIASFRGMDLDVHEGLQYGMRRDRVMSHAIRALLRRADRTTYVSDYLRRIGLSLGADPGADPAVFRSLRRAYPGLADGGIRQRGARSLGLRTSRCVHRLWRPAGVRERRPQGFVVPVGDVPAMAERVGRLLHEPALADALGRAGRLRMVEGFGYARMIGEIGSLYEETLRALLSAAAACRGR